MTKIISGTFRIEKKWDLIWFISQNKQSKEVIKQDIFMKYLLNVFDFDYAHKILEAINSDKKLIIDFDNGIVKLIKDKDEPFIKSMKTFFNINYLNQLDENETSEFNIYDNIKEL